MASQYPTERSSQKELPEVLLDLGEALETVTTAVSVGAVAAAESHPARLGRVIYVVVVRVGFTVITS